MQSGSTKREFTRVKHGEQPGEISRRAKIYMREKGTGFYYLTWQLINEKCSKSFRKYLSDKSKTVQRRRDKQVIRDQSHH